ncbi:hypothetical protein HanPSC8_Chr02g0062931 [Helianthus annuus]|nr:hypothetical protein HanPSC8_Chr02g0062931 [Helianthus annuus]
MGNKLLFHGGHSKETSDNVTVCFIDLESQVIGGWREPVANVLAQSFTVLGLPYPVWRRCRTEWWRILCPVCSTRSRTLTESSSNQQGGKYLSDKDIYSHSLSN